MEIHDEMEVNSIEGRTKAKRSYSRFKYSIDALKQAIEEVKLGKISANKAAKLYGIPKGTLIKKLHSNQPLPETLKLGSSPIFLIRSMESSDEIEEVEERTTAPKSHSRFKYSIDALKQAIEEVKSGKISATKAAKLYGIPKATLMQKLHSNKPLRESLKMGPSPILTDEEEIKLKQWILGKAEIGFPTHHEEVLDAVQKIVQETGRANPFKDNRPGMKWLKLFLKRHPEISKKNDEIISKAGTSVTEEKISDWFSELESYLKDEGAEDILQEPSRILNLDETGLLTCPSTGQVLGTNDNKNYTELSSDPRKECITAFCAYSADGNAIPALTPCKRMPSFVSVPSSVAVVRSDPKQITRPTLFEYVVNVLLPSLVKAQIKFPVLLLIDSQKLHINEDLYKFCRENNIFIYGSLPNGTHFLHTA